MNTTSSSKQGQQYKYFAFISYSSKDIFWGRKLQRTLELYRLPSRLQKKYKDLPARMFPIFRDETDLSGFKVRHSLEQELDDSQYLIVLCSPRSAVSTWVNDEVQHFIDLGREDKILPLIIDGIPYSGDPETECFPPALRNMNNPSRGVNVPSLGWHKAYLNMISTLLSVEYDELLLRDTHRRIRNGVLAGLAGLALMIGIANRIWYYMPHSKYYSAYTFQNEIPVEIEEFELSEEERAHINYCYRITTQCDQVRRLETVNSLGVVVDPFVRPATIDYPILEFEYKATGELASVLQKDATGAVVSHKVLTVNEDTNEIAIDFRSPSNVLDPLALSSDMSSYVIGEQGQTSKSEITRQRNTYDERGFLIRSMYQRDGLGTPACDSNGVYGKAYEYNDQGLVVRIHNLDENGQLFNCKYGWAYEEFTYNEAGNPILTEYFDAAGNKARCKDGYCAIRITYDSNRNPTRFEFLDEEGQLTYTVDGYAMMVYQYNASGLPISEKHLDVNEGPVYDTNCVHETRIDYDAFGRICGLHYYDTAGEPVYSPVLCGASLLKTLDEDGRILEEFMLDTQGNPSCHVETGTYGYRYTYDEHGYLLETVALDENRKPAASKYGNAITITYRDSAGRVIREEYRDAYGNLMRNNYNVAYCELKYDTFGNCIKVSYFDENNDPCFCAAGYSSVEFFYKQGNLISQKYFDTNGAPTLCDSYNHELRMDYDEKGNCIRWSHYDTKGNLVNLKEGYSVWEQRYDRYGNVTEIYHFDAEGNPACYREAGVYAMRLTYDKNGHPQKTEYLDTQGNLSTSKYGYAAYVSVCDSVGRVLKNSYFDEAGNLVRGVENYAIIEYEYDNTGNVIEIRVFDENGVPCYHSSGYASQTRVYDAGNLISEKCFDTEGKPMLNVDYYHEVRTEYDDKGNCVRWSYYDTEGCLLDSSKGYAILEQQYDVYCNVTEQSFYTANGEPAVLLDIHKYQWEYDRQGNMIWEKRHSLFPDSLWCLIVEVDYDVLGNPVERHFFDENNKPLTSDRGPCQEKMEYDRNGNVLRDEFIFDQGTSSICEYTYDAQGNNTLEAWYRKDTSGETVCVQQTRMAYDTYGNCIRTDYLDGTGKPRLQEDGYASLAQGFSPTGEVIWAEYYNEAGDPALYKGHTFRYEYDYDARGCWTEIRMYDASGNPHKEASGLPAIIRYAHDARGIRTYEGRFNENGEPYGTEEDPYSAKYYTIDQAGFMEQETWCDKNGDLLSQSNFYAYAGEIYAGKSGAAAGIEPGQFVIQLGDWNYFDSHLFSASSDLRAEVSRTVYSTKVLVLCEWTADDTFVFRKYDMPAGEMGIRIMGDVGDVRILKRMEEAYHQWLEDVG